jgi:hypothetical protein
MDMVKSVLQEELESAKEKLKFYQEGINELPKGSISKKLIHGKEYYYLKHREGKSIKTDYLGKLPDDARKIDEYREKILSRNRLKINLKIVIQEIKYLEKVLNARAK